MELFISSISWSLFSRLSSNSIRLTFSAASFCLYVKTNKKVKVILYCKLTTCKWYITNAQTPLFRYRPWLAPDKNGHILNTRMNSVGKKKLTFGTIIFDLWNFTNWAISSVINKVWLLITDHYHLHDNKSCDLSQDPFLVSCLLFWAACVSQWEFLGQYG